MLNTNRIDFVRFSGEFVAQDYFFVDFARYHSIDSRTGFLLFFIGINEKLGQATWFSICHDSINLWYHMPALF